MKQGEAIRNITQGLVWPLKVIIKRLLTNRQKPKRSTSRSYCGIKPCSPEGETLQPYTCVSATSAIQKLWISPGIGNLPGINHRSHNHATIHADFHQVIACCGSAQIDGMKQCTTHFTLPVICLPTNKIKDFNNYLTIRNAVEAYFHMN